MTRAFRQAVYTAFDMSESDRPLKGLCDLLLFIDMYMRVFESESDRPLKGLCDSYYLRFRSFLVLRLNQTAR